MPRNVWRGAGARRQVLDERERIVHLLPVAERGVGHGKIRALAGEPHQNGRARRLRAGTDALQLVRRILCECRRERIEQDCAGAELLQAVVMQRRTALELHGDGAVHETVVTPHAHVSLDEREARSGVEVQFHPRVGRAGLTVGARDEQQFYAGSTRSTRLRAHTDGGAIGRKGLVQRGKALIHAASGCRSPGSLRRWRERGDGGGAGRPGC